MKSMTQDLLAWYDVHKRVLPWRDKEVNPYYTWVSEIMLQQTRVETVIDYYQRFIKRFPDVESLANSEEDELFKLWEGLGYYSRCRNLRKGAQYIVENYRGDFPKTEKEWLQVPGVGPYTAAAIASIVYHEPVPAVDGNLLRVASRLYVYRENILNDQARKWCRDILSKIIDKERPGDFNQALMDLGSSICRPKELATCLICPLREHCQAYTHQEVAILPKRETKIKKKVEELTLLLMTDGEHTIIQKRPNKGILASLYEFPNINGRKNAEDVLLYLKENQIEAEQIEEGPYKKHIFTHIKWEIHSFLIKLSPKELQSFFVGESSYELITFEEVNQSYSLPTAFKKFLDSLKQYAKKMRGVT